MDTDILASVKTVFKMKINMHSGPKKEAGTFGPTSSTDTKYFSYTRFSLIRAFLPVRARK